MQHFHIFTKRKHRKYFCLFFLLLYKCLNLCYINFMFNFFQFIENFFWNNFPKLYEWIYVWVFHIFWLLANLKIVYVLFFFVAYNDWQYCFSSSTRTLVIIKWHVMINFMFLHKTLFPFFVFHLHMYVSCWGKKGYMHIVWVFPKTLFKMNEKFTFTKK